MTVDPVLSLLIGALGAALIGLLGAWIQSRREHAKWLREKRYAAYLAFLQIIDRTRMGATIDAESYRDASTEVAMVGPYSLLDATGKYLEKAAEKGIAAMEDDEELIGLRQDWILAAQKRLGIRRWG